MFFVEIVVSQYQRLPMYVALVIINKSSCLPEIRHVEIQMVW
ncbi:hypothetical protein [Vibrio gallaecicus]|nr:hypothetical protein [Vibrio gallaecicus]MDN3617361.1 hypothetical protein [Vibrio gallaecicus]MDN3617429.1 hypothetical protein [Vibrio gallaecicus]